MSVLKEFREFAVKGNVVDLAVGVIIGASFGKIVASLVADVIMPPLGLLIGGMDFSDLAFVLKAPSVPGAKDGVLLSYGKFIQTVFDFLIQAWAIFVVVKGINALKRRVAAEQPAAPAKPPEDVVLLGEIRDLLKSGNRVANG